MASPSSRSSSARRTVAPSTSWATHWPLACPMLLVAFVVVLTGLVAFVVVVVTGLGAFVVVVLARLFGLVVRRPRSPSCPRRREPSRPGPESDVGGATVVTTVVAPARPARSLSLQRTRVRSVTRPSMSPPSVRSTVSSPVVASNDFTVPAGRCCRDGGRCGRSRLREWQTVPALRVRPPGAACPELSGCRVDLSDSSYWLTLRWTSMRQPGGEEKITAPVRRPRHGPRFRESGRSRAGAGL